MTTERKSYVDSLKTEAARKRTVAGELLVKSALKDDGIVILKDEYGKPFIKGSDKYISISHSNDYAVCAVSDSPVGIDIEIKREINLNTTRKFCNDTELAYITANDSQNRFFEIWTAKEAAYKLIGGKEKSLINIDVFKYDRKYFNFSNYFLCIILY